MLVQAAHPHSGNIIVQVVDATAKVDTVALPRLDRSNGAHERQRLPDRRAAHAQPIGQFPLGRQLVAGAEAGFLDQFAQPVRR